MWSWIAYAAFIDRETTEAQNLLAHLIGEMQMTLAKCESLCNAQHFWNAQNRFITPFVTILVTIITIPWALSHDVLILTTATPKRARGVGIASSFSLFSLFWVDQDGDDDAEENDDGSRGDADNDDGDVSNLFPSAFLTLFLRSGMGFTTIAFTLSQKSHSRLLRKWWE